MRGLNPNLGSNRSKASGGYGRSLFSRHCVLCRGFRAVAGKLGYRLGVVQWAWCLWLRRTAKCLYVPMLLW